MQPEKVQKMSDGPEKMNTAPGSKRYRWLLVITAIFVTTLVISNIIAVKLVSIGGLFLPAAVVLFPISYIFGDILTEVYGYAQARRVIWTGFFCNFLAVIAIWISSMLPSAPFWSAGSFNTPLGAQAAYEAILGFTPRLLAASFIAYLIGEFLNSYVLAKLKIKTQGHLLWLRTITSTIVGEGADSVVFLTVAFWGIIPANNLGMAVLSQWLFKVSYEVLATPLTYWVVNWLKRVENEDFYDRQTIFNPVYFK
jgi:queuosine precursor transporter